MTCVHKYIEKAIEDQNTGADVKYHEITAMSIDFKHHFTTVTVESYISRRTKELGKNPVGSPITLNINNTPCPTENPIDWLYNQLIQPVPADYVEPEQMYEGWINPYAFSGGVIKETPKTE